MHEITPVKRRDALVLLLILLVAALMRFGQPGIVEYFHDDAMVASMAQAMVAGESLPLTGIISSVGIPNPPVTIYVMAIPFAISSDPSVAILFIMLLNVVGVGIFWLLVHRYFGALPALIAGLTLAVSPWAVMYSRKIWAQDYHTPFVLLALLLGLYGFLEATRRTERPSRLLLTRYEWAQALCLPVLLIGIQIHFAAWLLLPLYIILLLMGWRRVSWRALTVSAGLTLLVLMPYLVGLAQTLEQDPSRITAAINRSEASDGLVLSLDAVRNIAYLTTGFGIETWVTQGNESALLTAVPPVSLWWLTGTAAIAGIAGLIVFPAYRRYAPLVLVWAFFPVLMFTPLWTPVYPHYFVASIPALHLLVGIGVTMLIRFLVRVTPLRRTAEMIILLAYVLILLTQALWWRGTLRFVDSTHLDYPQFTTPLHRLQTIEEDLQVFDDVIVVSYGMSWDLHHESVVWETLLEGEVSCVRTVIDGYAVLPPESFAVLIASDAPENPIMNLYQTDDPVIYPEREGGGVYTLHRWETAPEWTAGKFTMLETPALFEMGVRLTGYQVQDGILALLWELPEGEFGQDYQYTAQFFDADGERVAQHDTAFWHGRHWCDGDQLITYTDFDLPDTAETLHVGLYRLGHGPNEPRFTSASVVDDTGNPVGRSVIIPFLQDSD